MNVSSVKPNTAVRLLVLLVLYVGIVVWLTWPLAGALTEKLPCTDPACRFDTLYSAWVMAWQSHALVTQPAHVGDANIYWPARDALYYGPAGFGAVPYFAPTYLATDSAAAATNVMVLLCVALSALSLHWVVERWTGLASAGLVAGCTLLVQRWYLWGFVAATPHLAPLQYFPLIIYLAARPLERLSRAVLLAVLIVAQCLTDPVYVAAAVVAPVSLLVAWRLWHVATRRAGWLLAGALGASLVALVPFLLGYLRVRADNPLLAEQTLWRAPTTADLQGAAWTSKVVLAHWRSDLGRLVWWGSLPTTLVPPALVLVVAGVLLAIRRWRAGRPLPQDAGWLHGALWFVVGTFISLTPVAMLGSYRVYLPQYVLGLTTRLYEIIRSPGRLGVVAMVAGCILAGIGFAEVVRALAARGDAGRDRLWRGGLAVLVVLALYLVRPPGTAAFPASYPTQNVPPLLPEIATELAKERGPLLELPALNHKLDHWPSSMWNAQAMYLSTFHWRPLLNGYSSYWPEGFVARMDLAEELPSRTALATLVRTTGVRTILVHLLGYDADRRRRWGRAIQGGVRGLELRARARGQLVFAVDPAALADVPPSPDRAAAGAP